MRKKTPIFMLIALIAGALVAAAPADAARRCRKYNGGLDGKGAPLAKVTDKATKKKPKTVEVEVAPGAGFSSNSDNEGTGAASHQVTNVQVDTEKRMTGLWVLLEHDPLRDLDLYVSDASGQAVAYSAGFQAAPIVPGVTDGTGNGGKTTMSSEQVDGLRTPDCTGYTIEIWGAGNEPTTATLKLWLGKKVYP